MESATAGPVFAGVEDVAAVGDGAVWAALRTIDTIKENNFAISLQQEDASTEINAIIAMIWQDLFDRWLRRRLCDFRVQKCNWWSGYALYQYQTVLVEWIMLVYAR